MSNGNDLSAEQYQDLAEFRGQEGDCPVAEDVSDRLLRLPFYNDLTEADQARVIDAINDFQRQRSSALNATVRVASAAPDELQ